MCTSTFANPFFCRSGENALPAGPQQRQYNGLRSYCRPRAGLRWGSGLLGGRSQVGVWWLHFQEPLPSVCPVSIFSVSFSHCFSSLFLPPCLSPSPSLPPSLSLSLPLYLSCTESLSPGLKYYIVVYAQREVLSMRYYPLYYIRTSDCCRSPLLKVPIYQHTYSIIWGGGGEDFSMTFLLQHLSIRLITFLLDHLI